MHLFKLVCKETKNSYIFALRKRNILLNSKIHRGVEQSVARWAHNPKVAGSSPVPATTSLQRKLKAFFMPCIAFLLRGMRIKKGAKNSFLYHLIEVI